MKAISIETIRKRISNIHPRTRKAQLNTTIGLIVKGGGMFISFLLVPLTIDYLSKDVYGVWLTISSVITMIALFDVGIGNGLRNKLTEAVSKEDKLLARAYVSTAYLIFGLLQIILMSFFLLVFNFVPWGKILNTTIEHNELYIVILITAISVSIKLILDILSYVLFALQASGLVGLINLLGNIITLLGTYILLNYTSGNILYLAIVSNFSPIVILLISGFYLYKNQLQMYRPALRFIDLKYAKNLLSIGYKFFIIQLAVIVLFYTDNLIISQLFGPSEVTVYNVAFRYFNAATTVFTIAITPYWSAFTEAYNQNDRLWMKQAYKRLQKIWIILLVLVVGMIIIAEPVYSLWLDQRITVPLFINIALGVNVIIICWNNINVSVINGLGKIKLQLVCSIIATLMNVPLAIFLGHKLEFGSAGVVLSTCFSLLPATITGSIQARRLINNTAQGIWAS